MRLDLLERPLWPLIILGTLLLLASFGLGAIIARIADIAGP